MINANELTTQATSAPRSKPNLTILTCGLGLIILVVLYAKTIGF
jgi:hypothetical protein